MVTSAKDTVKAPARYDIYVDGSFKNGSTGYGAVVLKDGKVVEELSGNVQKSLVSGSRQVAGELVAVLEALKWCLAHGVKEVSIYYDYAGIEKWATRRWKTNIPLTVNYAEYVNTCAIKVHWHKVASHTGNRWNDRADFLAKQGAVLSSIPDNETDPEDELIQTAKKWIDYLMMNGVEASFDRILNEQFARVLISKDETTVGIFDLYNTKKKRMSPYLHNFRDQSQKLLVETLWNDFRQENCLP